MAFCRRSGCSGRTVHHPAAHGRESGFPDQVYSDVSAALFRVAADGQVLLHDCYLCGGALFIFDDSIIPDPGRALSGIRRNGSVIDVLPVGNLAWPTKPGSSATKSGAPHSKRIVPPAEFDHAARPAPCSWGNQGLHDHSGDRDGRRSSPLVASRSCGLTGTREDGA